MRLPDGYKKATAPNGKPYYYHRAKGDVTWTRPTDPALEKSLKLLQILMKETSTKKESIKNARQLLTRRFFSQDLYEEAFEGLLENMQTFSSSSKERLFRKKLAVLYVIDDVLRRCCAVLRDEEVGALIVLLEGQHVELPPVDAYALE